MVKDRLGREIKLTEEQATKAAETLLNAWLRDDGYVASANDSNKTDDKSK